MRQTTSKLMKGLKSLTANLPRKIPKGKKNIGVKTRGRVAANMRSHRRLIGHKALREAVKRMK